MSGLIEQGEPVKLSLRPQPGPRRVTRRPSTHRRSPSRGELFGPRVIEALTRTGPNSRAHATQLEPNHSSHGQPAPGRLCPTLKGGAFSTGRGVSFPPAPTQWTLTLHPTCSLSVRTRQSRWLCSRDGGQVSGWGYLAGGGAARSHSGPAAHSPVSHAIERPGIGEVRDQSRSHWLRAGVRPGAACAGRGCRWFMGGSQDLDSQWPVVSPPWHASR
jgi:hypothetical protein